MDGKVNNGFCFRGEADADAGKKGETKTTSQETGVVITDAGRES